MATPKPPDIPLGPITDTEYECHNCRQIRVDSLVDTHSNQFQERCTSTVVALPPSGPGPPENGKDKNITPSNSTKLVDQRGWIHDAMNIAYRLNYLSPENVPVASPWLSFLPDSSAAPFPRTTLVSQSNEVVSALNCGNTQSAFSNNQKCGTCQSQETENRQRAVNLDSNGSAIAPTSQQPTMNLSNLAIRTVYHTPVLSPNSNTSLANLPSLGYSTTATGTSSSTPNDLTPSPRLFHTHSSNLQSITCPPSSSLSNPIVNLSTTAIPEVLVPDTPSAIDGEYQELLDAKLDLSSSSSSEALGFFVDSASHRFPVYRRAKDAHATRNGYVEKKIRIRKQRRRRQASTSSHPTTTAVSSAITLTVVAESDFNLAEYSLPSTDDLD